ncbi:unnamed protein product [Anisakis simplex]|uniref:Histone acetyltransferase n=1 Tax=Anisakis simplex TaxID=6269 RepID=A0A3P6R144_ANISI|nr:unnamed protein product [Anisakis simplex]
MYSTMLRRNTSIAAHSRHPKLRHIQSIAVHKATPKRPQKRRLHSSHCNDQLENREQRVTRSKGSINDELYHRIIKGSEASDKRSTNARSTSQMAIRSNRNLNHSSNDIQQPALKRPKFGSNKKDVAVTPKRNENRRCNQLKRDMPSRSRALSVSRSDKHSMKRIDDTQTPSVKHENGSPPKIPDDQASSDHATRSPSMKTRGWTKMRKRLIPHCRVCKRDAETLIKCLSCGAQYHLECLEYDSDSLESVFEKRSCDWLCPKCIVCTSCAQFITDVNDHLKDKASAVLNRQHQTAKLRQAISPNRIKTSQSPRTPTLATNRMDLESNSPQRVKEREGSSSSSSDGEDENDANVQSSSSKKQLFIGDRLGLNKNTLEQCTASDDFQLFMNAKKQLADEVNEKESAEEPTALSNKDCWIHYANYKMKAVNESPFPKAIARAEHLFVCHFCLTPMTSRDRYEIHMQHCNWYHPPGNEIYRDEDLSFWEIDGSDEVRYCTRLCLLSILLLPSKVAYRDMETFIFYLLTEKTSDGHVLVGYFSKEKQPSQNNNLSCLLVFPMVQRAGYGKMLIDLSYKLSLKERKIGGPEHPLSNLGLLTYRSYWKAIIVSYVRSMRGRFSISIKEMSNATGIHIEDIIATLTLYNLLKSTNDSYYVDVKRVLRLPLRSFRYRAVKDEKLIWEPSFDVDKDPIKMGTYND